MRKEKTVLSPNFCVIGAGSGGLSFAYGASQMGASVVLIECNKMGGDCLNYGCVPSKALIAASKFSHVFKESSLFGWPLYNPKVDFNKVHSHVHSVIDTIAPHDSKERFEKLGVKVILEKGEFHDNKTLVTESYIIKAKRFVISTGSHPFIPPIKGLSNIPYLTNESIFELKKLPKHLVIIGGGPVGVEMAQAFFRLGSNVTILEASSVLAKDDQSISSKLKSILLKEGLEIKEEIKILSISKDKASIEIKIKDKYEKEIKLNASHVLVASGRRPNIQNLNLEKANIKFSPRGILVDECLRTSNRRVYAIGDCTGGYQFTHVAGYHASLALRNTIFKLRAKFKTHAIPWVTYTDPELTHVGFLEKQLIDKKVPYTSLQMSFKENDRAQTELKTEGLIKVLVTPKGHILGVSILGPHAGELISPWVIAIQNKLKISTIANSIAAYPTLSDINKRIAGSFYKDKIFSPFVKRIVKLLMRFTF